MKKILCILLAMSMSLAMLAGCANDGQQEISNDGQGGEEVISDILNLVVDGVSEYVIVYGENAYISEITAATELQSYIKQISGAELPIVTDASAPVAKEIVVGKTNRESDGEFDREELGDDGLVIKTNGQKLFLVGGEQRGTLYAVYEFLESYLGCRFYTNDFEKVPESKTVSVEQIEEDKQIPVFRIRSQYWADYMKPEISVKRKLIGRGHNISEEFGGSVVYASGMCHTLYSLAEMTGDNVDNDPCLNDEEVYQTVLKNVRALLAATPNADFISVSQNDSYDGYHGCQCDKCVEMYEKTGSYAGTYITFVNRIANEIKDEYPNVMVHTFAYRFTFDAPVGVVPADNVMVEVCTVAACRRHPISECGMLSATLDSDKNIKENLEDWAKICNNMSVWDYTTNYSHYSVTYPNFEALRENMVLFADSNTKYMFEQGNYQSTNGEFGELRAYLLSKLMWDPYMSEEEYQALIDEFLIDFYGPGGIYIREYINLALELTEDCHFTISTGPDTMFPYGDVVEVHNKYEYPDDVTVDMILNYETVDWSKYWNWFKDISAESPLTEKGYKLFESAMAMAETDIQKAHIEKSSVQVDYLMSWYYEKVLTAGTGAVGKIVRNYFTEHPDEFTTEEQWSIAKDIIKFSTEQAYADFIALNKELHRKVLEYNIIYLHEGRAWDSPETANYMETPYGWN